MGFSKNSPLDKDQPATEEINRHKACCVEKEACVDQKLPNIKAKEKEKVGQDKNK